MEFGLFNSVCVLPQFAQGDPGAEHRRIMDEVAIVEAADRHGFKYSWLTEHHFLTDYSHLSASEVMLGYLARATERIHLGSGIFNLTPPVNHPARIAERVAMLDHLSGGRFEFGIGRGSSTTEMGGFGITDPAVTRDMIDETLPEIVRMWGTTEYEHAGRFFSMPVRNVLPKPYTDPHPPLWIAAGNPATFEKAARLGLGVLCFTMGGIEPLKPLIELYKKTIEHAEPVGGYVNDNIMVTSQLLCLEDGQRVRDLVPTLAGAYQNSLVFRYLDTFPRPPDFPVWPDVLAEPAPEEIEARIQARVVCHGTPEEVARVIEDYRAGGVDQLVFGLLSSAMSRELALETLEVFGTQLIPAYDTDPVHRTVRMREST